MSKVLKIFTKNYQFLRKNYQKKSNYVKLLFPFFFGKIVKKSKKKVKKSKKR